MCLVIDGSRSSKGTSCKLAPAGDIPTHQIVVHHGVEKRCTAYYKHLNLTQDEIHSLEILRGIPQDLNTEVHLIAIGDIWREFYKKYPEGDVRVTKDMLFAVCKQVDDKFGTIFLPPIR